MPRSVVEEIAQTKPFGSLEEEVFVSLGRTTASLMRPFEDLLKANGLSASQYNVLRILRGAGTDGLQCRQIAQRMVSRDPDLTRLLDRLEGSGLIVRHREPRDRRAIVARISRDGSALLAFLDAPAAACQKEMLAHMGSDRLRTLADLLDQVRAGSRESP